MKNPFQEERDVTVRTRKFVGMLAMLAFLIVYCLIAMAVTAEYLLDYSGVVQLICFIIAGILWLPPVMMLIKWMQRED